MGFREIRQPESYDERRALALKTRDELQIDFPILIDTMDDLSRALFGDLPSPAVVIGPDRIIRAKLPWAEPERIEPRLRRVLKEPPGDLEKGYRLLKSGDRAAAAPLLERAEGPVAALVKPEDARKALPRETIPAVLVELAAYYPEKAAAFLHEAFDSSPLRIQKSWLLDRLAPLDPDLAERLRRQLRD
jgi:hypothetical protein